MQQLQMPFRQMYSMDVPGADLIPPQAGQNLLGAQQMQARSFTEEMQSKQIQFQQQIIFQLY